MKLKPLVILTLLISFIYFGLTIGWSHLSYKTLTTYCDETELEKSHVSELIMMQSNTLYIGDYSAAKPFTGFNLCKYEDVDYIGYYYRIEFSVYRKMKYFIRAPGCVNKGRVTYIDRRIV